MIFYRSSQLSTKFANKHRRDELAKFIDDFREVVEFYINQLWSLSIIPKFFSTKNDKFPNFSLSATTIQCAAKQACGIVVGERRKAKKQKRQPSFPDIKKINPELDYRFIKNLDWNNDTSFSGWLTLRRLTNIKNQLFLIPLKRTKHFNKLEKQFKQTKGIRLSADSIAFIFKSETQPRTQGQTVGIDVGISKTLSDSRGISTQPDIHGWTLSKVLQKQSRRKKGSKGFKRAQIHRDNFIGWSINQLDLTNVQELKVENLKNMKKGKNQGRLLRHWSYPTIFRRLRNKAEVHGVRVTEVNPRNTSRTCSACGTVDAKSRKGEKFRCVKCNFTMDADLNAAINIERAMPLKAQHQGVCSPLGEKSIETILQSRLEDF